MIVKINGKIIVGEKLDSKFKVKYICQSGYSPNTNLVQVRYYCVEDDKGRKINIDMKLDDECSDVDENFEEELKYFGHEWIDEQLFVVYQYYDVGLIFANDIFESNDMQWKVVSIAQKDGIEIYTGRNMYIESRIGDWIILKHYGYGVVSNSDVGWVNLKTKEWKLVSSVNIERVKEAIEKDLMGGLNKLLELQKLGMCKLGKYVLDDALESNEPSLEKLLKELKKIEVQEEVFKRMVKE